MTTVRTVDVVIVGGSLAAAAAAKRLVDAGFETIVLERKKLPRHKICSGILSPRGHRFLIENFGPLPREVLHEPTSCRGVTFHFPSKLSLSMDFDHGPTPHLHRKYSDYWAIQRSGVEVRDEAALIGFVEKDGWIDIEAKVAPERAQRETKSPWGAPEAASQAGETLRYRARHLIGADGPDSKVVRTLYPELGARMPWFMVGQKFHEIIECPLDTDYFHFWFHPQLGHYTWSHARDGRQIVGVGFPKGGNIHEYHARLVNYLEEKHGVKLGPSIEQEGCVENFGPSLINRYVFGKGNALVTGQAAGFLNMLAEGMSVALHSGAIAGEAIVEARHRNRPVQEMYRHLIASEVRRCSDQWNPIEILFHRPHEADFRAALKKLPLRHQAKMVRELIGFLPIYGRYNWGRQILKQAFYRMLHGGYDPASWG